MSLGEYTGWNARSTRKREAVREDVAPEPQPRDEPMEVQEDPLSQTGVIRFLRRVAGRTP